MPKPLIIPASREIAEVVGSVRRVIPDGNIPVINNASRNNLAQAAAKGSQR